MNKTPLSHRSHPAKSSISLPNFTPSKAEGAPHTIIYSGRLFREVEEAA
jgi:hypothetical protein